MTIHLYGMYIVDVSEILLYEITLFVSIFKGFTKSNDSEHVIYNTFGFGYFKLAYDN